MLKHTEPLNIDYTVLHCPLLINVLYILVLFAHALLRNVVSLYCVLYLLYTPEMTIKAS